MILIPFDRVDYRIPSIGNSVPADSVPCKKCLPEHYPLADTVPPDIMSEQILQQDNVRRNIILLKG